ncbi:MAG: hypothetical protein J6S67_26215 [Methanobrevibacter sp.]|nr:hypothetical protein [Methanobrevibacter sp.]
MEDLLFIELCERIPFGVRVILRDDFEAVKRKYERGEDISDYVYYITAIYPQTSQIELRNIHHLFYFAIQKNVSEIVLCLRNKHEMDEKEIDGALLELQTSAIGAYKYYIKNHFDFNGQIKRGYALEVKREFYIKD